LEAAAASITVRVSAEWKTNEGDAKKSRRCNAAAARLTTDDS
jgi:hypothetical protein